MLRLALAVALVVGLFAGWQWALGRGGPSTLPPTNPTPVSTQEAIDAFMAARASRSKTVALQAQIPASPGPARPPASAAGTLAPTPVPASTSSATKGGCGGCGGGKADPLAGDAGKRDTRPSQKADSPLYRITGRHPGYHAPQIAGSTQVAGIPRTGTISIIIGEPVQSLAAEFTWDGARIRLGKCSVSGASATAPSSHDPRVLAALKGTEAIWSAWGQGGTLATGATLAASVIVAVEPTRLVGETPPAQRQATCTMADWQMFCSSTGQPQIWQAVEMRMDERGLNGWRVQAWFPSAPRSPSAARSATPPALPPAPRP